MAENNRLSAGDLRYYVDESAIDYHLGMSIRIGEASDTNSGFYRIPGRRNDPKPFDIGC
jgi:hypothetical protein